jgi:membrane protease YdiL (CAAX protease family)
MKTALKILVIALYFLVSWLVPWPESMIPSYLLFDLIFSIFVLFLIKEKFNFKFNYTDLKKPALLILILAIAVLLLLILFKWQTPFLYITHYEIKLVLAAPIIEELLFRGALTGILRKHVSRTRLLFISAGLFSISHFYSFFITPQEFHSFILLQTGYTFILGYILAKDFEENFNFARVILLHFVFNVIFLVAIKTQLIN